MSLNSYFNNAALKAEHEMISKLVESGIDFTIPESTETLANSARYYSSDIIINGVNIDLKNLYHKGKKGRSKTKAVPARACLAVGNTTNVFHAYEETENPYKPIKIYDDYADRKISAWYRVYNLLQEIRNSVDEGKSFLLSEHFSSFDRHVFNLAINGAGHHQQYFKAELYLIKLGEEISSWYILEKEELFKCIRVYLKKAPNKPQTWEHVHEDGKAYALDFGLFYKDVKNLILEGYGLEFKEWLSWNKK